MVKRVLLVLANPKLEVVLNLCLFMAATLVLFAGVLLDRSWAVLLGCAGVVLVCYALFGMVDDLRSASKVSP